MSKTYRRNDRFKKARRDKNFKKSKKFKEAQSPVIKPRFTPPELSPIIEDTDYDFGDDS